jgi:hypothetical protein
MLASTVQFSKYGRPRPTHQPPPPGATSQTGPRQQPRPTPTRRMRPVRSLRTQQRAWAAPRAATSFPPTHAGCTKEDPHEHGRLVSVPPASPTPRTRVSSLGLDRTRTTPAGQALLRKEVIQPHLPVRLPCYDFVPIADPTFDSSPPHGLGHWLRVLPTFVT